MGSRIQPRRQIAISETVEELLGNLEVPEDPEVTTGHAYIYRGVLTNPNGQRLEVAVKDFRPLLPRNRHTDPEALRRRLDKHIRRERFAWSRTKHPNLHPLIGYCSQPRPRLISPWCDHGNLMDYLRENPGLSRRDKLCLVHQAALGLHHLHSRDPPICHGDIKPENILIISSCKAVISDFGLSRVLEDFSRGFTTSGGPKGTRNYMAGELFMAEKPRSDLQSDVFAFGGLILTVMSGKPPFIGLSEGNILKRLIENQPPKPEDHPDLPAYDPLWSLMRRCWNKSPAARPTMREIVCEPWEDICHEQSDPNLRSFVDTGGKQNSRLFFFLIPCVDPESIPRSATRPVRRGPHQK